jgi:hypothetical protein
LEHKSKEGTCDIKMEIGDIRDEGVEWVHLLTTETGGMLMFFWIQ